MKMRAVVPLLVFASLYLLLVGCGKASSAGGVVGCGGDTAAVVKPEPAKSSPAPAPINPAVTGTVAGVVKFEGTTPKLAEIDMSQDPACMMGPEAKTNFSESVQVKGGKLANVFVYVKEGLPAGNYGVPAEPVVIDQKGCRYVPHVAGAVAGQKVQFLNSDPTMHNVHPNAQANSPFNITQTPKGEPIERAFPKPELMMKVSCNQHPWMRMYLNVVEHPFFAISDAEGKFEIKGLPPGEYTLAFVHEKLGEKTAQVKVEAQKTSAVEVSLSGK
jgi:plastocyanin